MLSDRDDIADQYEDDQWVAERKRMRLQRDRESTDTLDIVTRYQRMWLHDSARGASGLFLGSVDEARAAFVEATAFNVAYLYIVETSHRADERLGGNWNAYLQNAEETLETAVLGGDPAIETRAVEQARQYTDEDATKPHFQYWHNRVRALGALINGDNDQAIERLEAAEAHLDVADFATAEPALELYRGLAGENEDAIEDAAADLAAIAEREFEPPAAHGRQLVSFHAVAGLALARRRGLDVTVESDAIPDVVYRHDWAHREHDLSELARKTLEAVDADERDS